MTEFKDTFKGTIVVATALSLVCSIIVSFSAVLLRPIQEKNKALDMKTNILAAAGLYQEGVDVEEVFASNVKASVIELASGQKVDIDPSDFDEKKAAKSNETGESIAAEDDIAGIRRKAKHSLVYEIMKDGKLDQVVLPIKGKGLWSTLFGFVAVASDANTIRGLGFYQHGETPGLGGEVDNPRWKSLWQGKKIKDAKGAVRISVIKGSVDKSKAEAIHQVDGLSGATITARGVSHLVQFWLGPHGFEKYLERVKAGGV